MEMIRRKRVYKLLIIINSKERRVVIARNQIKERKRVKMKNLNANNNECVFVCVQKNLYYFNGFYNLLCK